jgi:hypothetical protein
MLKFMKRHVAKADKLPVTFLPRHSVKSEIDEASQTFGRALPILAELMFSCAKFGEASCQIWRRVKLNIMTVIATTAVYPRLILCNAMQIVQRNTVCVVTK